ncbi:hypothetical protein [Paraneptunicella aestuarii]|uniref:hypothetical protein n=1 Tax=Paraneptunicella aestuarii TaxID=2831148 RepID=UPI001E416BCD|nr:hypothetical protein [Paraneptunicella aestuarii]
MNTVVSIKQVTAELIPGHQIASGLASNSPYPAGSIELQIPHFKALGLDLSHYRAATLNLSIKPYRFEWLVPDYKFEQVQWIEGFNPETFWFAQCVIRFQEKDYNAWIYYPHPETKTQHFHSEQVLEIICEPVPDIAYGDSLILQYDPQKIRLY